MATSQDFERLRAFDHQYRNDGSPRYYERQWQSFLDCASSSIYLAQNKANEIMGFIHINDIGDEILIEYLYVAPPFRRQGIARTLMQKALDVSDEKECAATLFMLQQNKPAGRLYRYFGFCASGMPGFDGMVCMVREPVCAPKLTASF